MLNRHHRASTRSYYTLQAQQLKVVDQIANSLPTAELRNSFLVRLASALKLAAPVGQVGDELLDAAIQSVLRELEGMAA